MPGNQKKQFYFTEQIRSIDYKVKAVISIRL